MMDEFLKVSRGRFRLRCRSAQEISPKTRLFEVTVGTADKMEKNNQENASSRSSLESKFLV